MGYQLLQGITVVPFGVANRYLALQSLFNATSKAFGGWIYNANVEVGFSQGPTSITLDISLDTQDGKYLTNLADFDITKDDLKVHNKANGDESYFEISFGSKIYKPMFLSSFEISGSADSKTLKVKFLDYSIILDKIYIAIFKKQDYKPDFRKYFSAMPEISALCPGCALDDPTFYEVKVNPPALLANGSPNPAATGGIPLVSNIESAAYFYNYKNLNGTNLFNGDNQAGDLNKINGVIPVTMTKYWPNVPPLPKRPELYRTYYNRTFSATAASTFSIWNSTQKRASNGNRLDINGGTVVLGTEEFNQSVCGSAAEVSYNFTELITILAKAGLNFSILNSLNHLASSPDIAAIDKNKNYRKNYNGTLREVLGNWCADFALDFYIDGTRIHFIDLSTDGSVALEADIEKIVKITSPNNTLGATLNSDKNYAIGSFTESADIGETYEQRLITFKVKPKKSEERSKEKKNHCGFLAMHPLDLLNPNMTQGDYLSMYNKLFKRPILANHIWGGTQKRHWYTNRNFEIIDKCAAIGKYSQAYRNIFAGGLICQTDPSIQMQGFNSFAFMPLYKMEPLHDEQARLDLIEKVFKSSGSEQKYVVDHNTFDIWIGIRDEAETDEIIEWEKTIADSMYKYGVLVKGPGTYRLDENTPSTRKAAPFVPEDFATQAGLTVGIDRGSLKLLKVSSSSTPGFERYRFFDDAPFKDLFRSPSEFINSLAKDLPIASLDNDWGTPPETFNEEMKILNHASAKCNNWGQVKLINNTNPDPDGSDRSPDSFSVEDFQPKFEDLPDDIFEDDNFGDLKAVLLSSTAVQGALGKLLVSQKQRSTAAGVTPYSQGRCPKLQMMIIPRVAAYLGSLNPHLKVTFNFDSADNDVQLRSIYKKEYLERIERFKEFRKTKCDYPLEDIVCNIGKLETTAGASPATVAADCLKYSSAPAPACVCVTPINEDSSQQYKIGFDTGSPPSAKARRIRIRIDVHHGVTTYVGVNSILKPLSGGGVGFLAADEDYPEFLPQTARSSIVYPRESNEFLASNGENTPTDQSYLYRGVINQSATFQLRSSETIECHGTHWNGSSNVSKIQLINNEVGQEIDQIVDPVSKGFYSPVYDMQGNAIKTIAQYHNLMAELSNSTKTSNILPARTMNFEVIGNVLDIADFTNPNTGFLYPHKGLKSLSFTLSSEGFRSNLSFSNRALKLPKPEAIMNKIRATF